MSATVMRRAGVHQCDAPKVGVALATLLGGLGLLAPLAPPLGGWALLLGPGPPSGGLTLASPGPPAWGLTVLGHPMWGALTPGAKL